MVQARPTLLARFEREMSPLLVVLYPIVLHKLPKTNDLGKEELSIQEDMPKVKSDVA